MERASVARLWPLLVAGVLSALGVSARLLALQPADLVLSVWTFARARGHLRELGHNGLFEPLRDLDPDPHPPTHEDGAARASHGT